MARAGNLSRAAKALNYSQPAISARMARLERSLGMPLIERHSRGVSLTAAGEIVAEHARRMIELEDAIKDRLSYLSARRSRLLPVSAGYIAGTYYLPCSVWTFEQGNRGVHIRLTVTTPLEVIHSVIDGRSEIGVCEGGVESDGVLSVEVIGNEPVWLVTAPSYGQRCHPGSKADVSLSRLNLLALDYGSGLRELTEGYLAGSGRNLGIAQTWKMTSLEGLKAALVGGLGMAFLPRCAVIKEIHERKLTQVALPDGCFDLPVSLVYRQDHELSAEAVRFLEFLKRPCAACNL